MSSATLQNLHACQVLTSCAISAQLIRVMRLLIYTDTLNYFYLFQSTVMLGRYDRVGLLPKHLSVSHQLMMRYPLCTSEHSQAFVQDQTWQLKIIEARTKFTMPPLQKTKRLMLSDLESVTPK